MSMVTTFGLTLRAALAAGTFLLAPSHGNSAPDGIIEVPAALNPDKLSILQVISARGAQVYTCGRSPAGATSWVFKAPDAQLFDPQNKVVGTHYAGPTWEDLDGGTVVGAVRTSMPAPIGKAIPWLLLDIKSRQGSGAFAQARAIVRMETTGGIVPDEGCDEARAGQEVRIPYMAVYVFLK